MSRLSAAGAAGVDSRQHSLTPLETASRRPPLPGRPQRSDPAGRSIRWFGNVDLIMRDDGVAALWVRSRDSACSARSFSLMATHGVDVASGAMSTGIYGGIEFRHPGVGTDDYEGEPWIAAMDLWPLYDQTDYASFGCLFGVRNHAGYRPLAADRGLPDDLSSGLREQLQPWVAEGHWSGATWVGWAEIAALDPDSAPEHYVGRLTWSSVSPPSTLHQHLVPAQWPPETIAAAGPRPPELDDADQPVEWTSGNLLCRYEPLRAGSILGTGSHWPHVFAVMKALADRFGKDAVRLVVAFD